MIPLPPLVFVLLAQAGGGGSFGSGGGGSGGGGGGGYGGGGGDGEGFFYLVRLLIWLMQETIEHPRIGIPCWLVGLTLVGIGLRRGWFEHQERAIRRARPQRKQRAGALALARLKGADPSFDPGRFLARVRLAFQRAQEGWCAHDLEKLRPFVSDGVLERFSLQLAEQRADGWRQGMDGLVLAEPMLLHFAQGEVFDALTVRVSFQARIDRRALADGRRLPGSELPRRHFSECWTFLRRRGTPSLVGEGLLEGKCTGCAAPLTLNRTARCTHCGAHVKNGRFDWVLVEITQESAWTPEDEQCLPGFSALRARDPGLSAAALEDRASVAFWRLAAAERARSTAPLSGLADEGVRGRLEERVARGPELVARAVGSVRTLGVVVRADGEHALVEVLWDGLAPGSSPQSTGRRRLRRTLLVLRRASGATSDANTALSTAHCRNCGAHDDGALEPQCAYCQAARLLPESDWRLADVLAAGSHPAVAWCAELGSDRRPSLAHSSADLLRWGAALARTDGTLEPRELRALEKLAEALGLGAHELPAVLAEGSTDALRSPGTLVERQRWFQELVRIAMADAKLARAERAFLARVSHRLGFSPRGLRSELDAARRELWSNLRKPGPEA